MLIEQAVYGGQGPGGYQFRARSPGFRDDWRPEAERLCMGFGERPAGVACPGCVFARPFGPGHVAVVQAADQGADDAGRPGALAFRLLVLPRELYDRLGGDPFRVADAFPPDWQGNGPIPSLEWTAGASPERTAADVRKLLDVAHSATLLGGVQAVVDGRRLVFERATPDSALLRSLWALLPADLRGSVWPATFAFGNALHFDAVALPRAAGPDFAGYVTEAQAGDYPEGRYELGLQRAAEADDQGQVAALLSGSGLARMSRTTRILAALAALVFFLVLPTLALLFPPPPPSTAPAAAAAGRPDLPPADSCPKLDDSERQRLSVVLHRLAAARGAAVPDGDADEDLTKAVAALDAKLGTPDPKRDPGPLADLGPIQRQLRALLWKHHVAGYDARGVSTPELVEKLADKVGPAPGG